MKISQYYTGRQVLGVMVDGVDLRIAHLGKERGEVVIYRLESITLPRRLGAVTHSQFLQPSASDNSPDVFGLEDDEPQLESFEEISSEEGDISGTLLNVFATYPLRKAPLAVSIPEGQVAYYQFESDFNLKGKKFTKRLREEIAALSGGLADGAVVSSYKLESGGISAVVFEGSVPLVDNLLEIKAFLASGPPRLRLYGTNELALVNLVRANLEPADEEITAILFIGCDTSNVIFMKGGYPVSFPQRIREGYSSPHVCQTLFSKILLELEEASISELHQLVLCGEIGRTRAFEYFTQQFPEAKVLPITPGNLNVSDLKAEEIAVFPNFAIPVALAWQALEPKSSAFINVDLLPTVIRDSQRAFKVAWHGFLLLGVIFVCVLLLSYQGLSRRNSIHSLKESTRLKEEALEALQPELIYINLLQNEINSYKNNLSFLDSIVVDPTKWSRLFAKFQEDFKKVNHLWIQDIQSDAVGFTMVGRSLNRDRIPKIAAGFPQAELRRVTRVIDELGEVTYEFEITASIPPEAVQQEDSFAEENANSQSAPVPTMNERQNPVPVATPPVTQTIEATSPPPRKAKEAVSSKPTSNPAAKQAETADQNANIADQSAKTTQASEEETSASEENESSRQRYEEAVYLLRAGHASQAQKILQDLVRHQPPYSETAAAQYWLGEFEYAANNYSAALRCFEASLSYPANPKRQEALLMSGITHLALQNQSAAQQQFQTLLKEYPDSEYAKLAHRKLQTLSQNEE